MKDWEFNLLRIAFVVVVGGGLFGLFLYQTSPPKFDSPKEAIGTVVNFIVATRGFNAKVSFFVAERKFDSVIDKHEGMAIYDKYKVIYEEANPNKSQVLLTEPVFITGEETIEATGYIVKVNSIGGDFVRYKYEVNGISYSRIQLYLPEQYNPKRGESYLVICWQQDPQRSIIYLRNPIETSRIDIKS